MKYIIKPWSRFLISLFGGSMLSELTFISTGDPNRQRGSLENIIPLFCVALLYFTFTIMVDNKTVKFSGVIDNSKEAEPLRIYSKLAILICSFFFTPIFAGFLLRQNLIEAKNKNAANIILFLSIIITVLSFNITNQIVGHPSLYIYLLNFIWTALLTQYVFKTYFQQGNYLYKKIWKPLLIVVSIVVALIFLNVFLK